MNDEVQPMNQFGKRIAVVLLFIPLLNASCRGPYSLARKYPDLIGATVAMKQDMVICSTEGENFGIPADYIMLAPRQVDERLVAVAEVKAGESVRVLDIICTVGKAGQRCNFRCVYEKAGRVYEFYWGGFEEVELPEVATEIWEYSTHGRKSLH